MTYDEKLGYFTTSVDASKLTDLSLLHQCVTLNAPKNAVYFKFTGEGGNENPATHDIKDDVNRFTEQFSSPDTDLQPVDPDRPIRMPLMHTEELKLDGKTVYYSESQSYNSLIVQWLDKGKNVIGYTCTGATATSPPPWTPTPWTPLPQRRSAFPRWWAPI